MPHDVHTATPGVCITPRRLTTALTFLAALLLLGGGGGGVHALSTRDDTILGPDGKELKLMGANWFGFNNGQVGAGLHGDVGEGWNTWLQPQRWDSKTLAL